MRFFLAAHRHGSARRRIPQPSLLDDASATFNQLNLPIDLVLKCLLQVTERVKVLHLGLRPEPLLPCRPNRYVRVTADASLLHVSVVDTKPDEDVAKPLKEPRGLRSRALIRLRDDFNQRHAASVVVDIGAAVRIRKALMQRLPRILLHVDPRQTDALCPTVNADVEPAAKRERPLV